MADATTDVLMSDAAGDEDLSTHRVIIDPLVDQSWLLKCRSTDLTRHNYVPTFLLPIHRNWPSGTVKAYLLGLAVPS